MTRNSTFKRDDRSHPLIQSLGPMQMKCVNFTLLTFLGLICYAVLIYASGNSAASTFFVFRPDGTIQCDKFPGVTLDSMEQELRSVGIKVFSSRKGYDGREGIALCGEPTGQTNVYEIAS